MLREVLFPKWEEHPKYIWFSTEKDPSHRRAVMIWYWILFPFFGLFLFQFVFSRKMGFMSFWLFSFSISIFLTGILYLQSWSLQRGSWTLELNTSMVEDFDEEALVKIIGQHLGPAASISVKDDALIIETGGNIMSLYCGQPDEFFGEWYLHRVKGEKLRLDSAILEPLREGIIEFLNREIPLDKEYDSHQSEYKGPIPDWFKEGFRVEYVESFKNRKNATSETAIGYSIVRNRAGSLLIKCRSSDDFSINQYVKSIDEYYDERDWWMFHMPPQAMQNNKNEIDTIIYSRTGPKRIHSPIGVFECIGFNFDGLEDCHCATEKNNGPGTCQECKGRKYRMYFPPMKCDRCKGTGVCSSCDGKKKRYRSETYWYDSRTGFLIKWELKVSGSETDAVIQKIEPPDLLFGNH